MDEKWSVELDNVVKRFGEVTAVDCITLKVRPGEFFGFLGPNGAGKSTTIKMMCGLLRPDQGSIRILGFDVRRQPLEVKKRIGALMEEPNLYYRLTGEEFLVFSGQMYGLSAEQARSRAEELLQFMRLNDARNKLVGEYSMGMKKKTALAAALIHSPEVLFLDEPFSGIDAISMSVIRDALDSLLEKGATIFFSSHVLEVAEKLCSRVAIINKGRIIADGKIPEIKKEAGLGEQSSLEEVFLNLVQAKSDKKGLSWI